ncbi:phosphotransferase [Isosphaeraceae bacterium EP7]
MTILRAMVTEALREGLLVDALDESFEHHSPASGSTADKVEFVSHPLRFVVKYQGDPKLVREAKMLRRAAIREDLTPELRAALPTIYAIKDDEPPFAYIMQHFRGFGNMAELLVKHQDDGASVARFLNAALDLLLAAYASSAARPEVPILPDVRRINLGRLERLEGFASGPSGPSDPDQAALFGLLNRPGLINDEPVPPFSELAEGLRDDWDRISHRFLPAFATFVHGDPNPENILLRPEGSLVRVKLIDPKEWGDGDYVFDIAKISHYLMVTWAVEKADRLRDYELNTSSTPWTLRYRLDIPGEIRDGIGIIEARLRQFAEDPPPPSWRDPGTRHGRCAIICPWQPTCWASRRAGSRAGPISRPIPGRHSSTSAKD